MYLQLLLYFTILVLTLRMGYLLYFLKGLSRTGIPVPESSKHLPGVSIIIAARNELKNLQDLVPLLLKQNYHEYEIVIIDDRSNDATEKFLASQSQNQKIRIVKVKSTPDHINAKKYALTLGIKSSKHDILLFTDADCRPVSENWIREMVSSYTNDTKIVVGFSPYIQLPGFLNLLIRYETLVTGIFYLASAANKHPYMGVGRNLSYRKEFFFSKKGFNGYQQITGGDDDLFVNRNSTPKNLAVALSKHNIVTSLPKTTWREYLHQKIRHLSTGKYYKKRVKIFLGLFWIVQILSWIQFVLCMSLSLAPVFILVLFLLGEILLILNFKKLADNTRIPYPLSIIPFLDIIYSIFYIFVGIRTMFTKKVEWTT